MSLDFYCVKRTPARKSWRLSCQQQMEQVMKAITGTVVTTNSKSFRGLLIVVVVKCL